MESTAQRCSAWCLPRRLPSSTTLGDQTLSQAGTLCVYVCDDGIVWLSQPLHRAEGPVTVLQCLIVFVLRHARAGKMVESEQHRWRSLRTLLSEGEGSPTEVLGFHKSALLGVERHQMMEALGDGRMRGFQGLFPNLQGLLQPRLGVRKALLLLIYLTQRYETGGGQ